MTFKIMKYVLIIFSFVSSTDQFECSTISGESRSCGWNKHVKISRRFKLDKKISFKIIVLKSIF